MKGNGWDALSSQPAVLSCRGDGAAGVGLSVTHACTQVV